jgi:hypothetical protein
VTASSDGWCCCTQPRVSAVRKVAQGCDQPSSNVYDPCLQGAVGAVGLHSSSGGGATSDRPHAYVEYESEENAIIAVAAMHDSEGW